VQAFGRDYIMKKVKQCQSSKSKSLSVHFITFSMPR
jgi:hypothetical protein